VILGTVTAGREAIIRLMVFGGKGAMHEVEAAIDTGFTEDLTLSQDLVDALELPFQSVDYTVLADGSTVACNIHEAEVLWDGIRRSILVQVGDSKPLVGMGLLMNYLLTLEGREDGTVQIAPL
jgi:clan AA aspartic protease